MGVAFAIAGAVPWILDAAGIGVYPGALHRSLMIQGFEQSFVLGFLLTALPGFLHAERCAAWELWLAVTLQIAFGIAAFSGATEWAQIAYLSSLALLGSAAVRRIGRSRARPPVEMVFVPFGILCGIAGAALTIAGRAGWIAEPIPGFAGRLLSLGMMLSVVLGMGGLLVPVFAGVRDPLVIPGIAAPQARAGRRVLYGAILVALASAFALEAIGQARLGMALRAAAASVMVLLVWKVWKRSALSTPGGWVLRTAGWLTMSGLWLAVAFPPLQVAALHVTLIGGFGLLTLGVGSRVVISHGGHGLPAERRLVTPVVVTLVVIAMVLRASAEIPGGPSEWPGRIDAIRGTAGMLAAAAACWSLAWLAWSAAALGLRGTHPRPEAEPGPAPVETKSAR